MNTDQFRKWLSKGIAREGGQIKFADNHKIDRSVMSLVMTGKREPSEAFAKALGWTKQTTFKKEKAE